MADRQPGNGDHRADITQNELTSIHDRIHCTATRCGDTENELDRIAVDTFLDTLAEVALAVSLRIRRREEG
ncbi:hypothetical protein ACFLXE_05230 [Chloroflexota bacterium]